MGDKEQGNSMVEGNRDSICMGNSATCHTFQYTVTDQIYGCASYVQVHQQLVLACCHPLYAMELALHVLKEHTVSFHPHSRVFNVRGHSGTPRVVSFNPKATCSCPATFPCCHIVILSYVDLQNGKEEKHKESLSLLGKNTISCIQGQNVRKEETLSSRSGHLLQSSP